MQSRLIKLKFRRRLRKGQRQVEDLSSQAEEGIEKHLFKRFDRLIPVRRFVIGWVGLVVLLIIGVVAQTIWLSGYYQTLKPVPGGIYNEGVRGRLTNANPIYASTDADKTVAKLIFAGLLTHDDSGNLIGDLASSYDVSEKGTIYTVHLKPNLTWQDGKPLTSEDVVFTYQSIQNPDAESPLIGGVKGVTVTAPDANTVEFKLPGALAAFPESLTTGIVPKHILGKIEASELRSAEFNTSKPVGAGPFAWDAIQVSGSGDPKDTRAQIALKPFASYARGEPKLQKLIVHVYASEEDLLHAIQDKQLTGAEGLTDVPQSLQDDKSLTKRNINLRAANMVFFKTTSGVLADAKVRQALVSGANVPQIINQLSYPAKPVRGPLLAGQLGYDPKLIQAPHNLADAQNTLNASGWVAGKDGIRTKDGKTLTFDLVAADNADNKLVAKELTKQWRVLGVKVNVRLQQPGDFQNSLSSHSYDAILNGIAIGVDPDVFVYWDSSQADIRSSSRLNLSEYKNSTADAALESGRTRRDPTLRVIKYKPFLQAWQQDNPALGLYQPRLLYITNGPVDGLSNNAISTSSDRFNNVQNWQIRQAKVTN